MFQLRWRKIRHWIESCISDDIDIHFICSLTSVLSFVVVRGSDSGRMFSEEYLNWLWGQCSFLFSGTGAFCRRKATRVLSWPFTLIYRRDWVEVNLCFSSIPPWCGRRKRYLFYLNFALLFCSCPEMVVYRLFKSLRLKRKRKECLDKAEVLDHSHTAMRIAAVGCHYDVNELMTGLIGKRR